MKGLALYTAGAVVVLLSGLLLFSVRGRPGEPPAALGPSPRKTGGAPLAALSERGVPKARPARVVPAMAEELSAAIASGPVASRERTLDRLFQRWTVLDAPAAADFALGISEAGARREAMLRVMQTWAVQDADGALCWARAAPFETSYERQIAMSMACTQVAFRDPEEAVRLALEYEPDQHGAGLLEGLAARWAGKDMQAARAWATSQPPGGRRDGLVESIALVLFETAPAGAVDLVMAEIPDGARKDQAMLTMMGKLAGRDPELALSWLNSFPGGVFRERAREQLAAQIAAQDP